MHIAYTHPDFATMYEQGRNRAEALFMHHHIFSTKAQLFNQLTSNQLAQLFTTIKQTMSHIQQKELPFWQQARFLPHFLTIDEKRQLEGDEMQFVLDSYDQIKPRFSAIFDQLHSACTSSVLHYDGISRDYFRFQQAYETVLQLQKLHQLLTLQQAMLFRLNSKAQANADLIHADVNALRNTLVDQTAIMSRLPPFR